MCCSWYGHSDGVVAVTSHAVDCADGAHCLHPHLVRSQFKNARILQIANEKTTGRFRETGAQGSCDRLAWNAANIFGRGFARIVGVCARLQHLCVRVFRRLE